MKYNFVRNVILASLVVTGVGLWGNAASDLSATVDINASSGDSQGSFAGSFTTTGFDNPTVLNNLYTNFGYYTPTETHTIEFDLYDLDGLDFNNFQIEMRFFHDVDHQNNTTSVDKIHDQTTYTEYQGNTTLDTAYEAHTETGADGDALVLRQVASPTTSNFLEVVYADGIDGDDVSWVLSNQIVTQTSAYEWSFDFDVTISKVATESTDGWTWMGRVLSADKTRILAENTATSIDVYWYGEIQIPAALLSSGIGFTGNNTTSQTLTLDVGSDYAENRALLEDVIFISNGDFDQLIGADNTWENGTNSDYDAYMADDASDIVGDSSAQYFHMVVSPTALTENHASATTVYSSGSNYADVIVQGSQEGTVESGRALDYYLYIKTAANFQNATYTGTIYLGIQSTLD